MAIADATVTADTAALISLAGELAASAWSARRRWCGR